MPADGEVLLVEDNENDAELTRLALSHAQIDHRVVHALDGAQALDMLFDVSGEPTERARAFRFVILDLKLPKVDGLQVLKRMKTHPVTRRIPVIILSSSNQERDVVDILEAGGNSYVVKPVQFQEYLEKVSSLGRYWNRVNEPPYAS